MLSTILNLLHLFIAYIPILIYFVPQSYVKSSIKYLFLLLIFVPVQWVILDGDCFLTTATKEVGGLEDKTFTEEYFSWLYLPIMKVLGMKNNEKNWKKMLYLHYGVDVILVWYYIFFVLDTCK